MGKKKALILGGVIAGGLALGAAAYIYFVHLGLRPGTAGLIPSSKQMQVPTGSMLPTLQVRQSVNVNLTVYLTSDPKLGDIVVFPAPSIALQPGQDQVHFFKRIVGLPGDVVEIRGGQLFRNDKAIDEPYVGLLDMMGAPIAKEEIKNYSRDFKLVKNGDEYCPLTIDGKFANMEFGRTAPKFIISDPEESRRLLAMPAAVVPPGFCIVMGDNRLNSFDSRGWGLVDLNTVAGRVETPSP